MVLRSGVYEGLAAPGCHFAGSAQTSDPQVHRRPSAATLTRSRPPAPARGGPRKTAFLEVLQRQKIPAQKEMIVDRRIGKINALRRRAPHSWPRPRDISSQTPPRDKPAVGLHPHERPRPPAAVAAQRLHLRDLHQRPFLSKWGGRHGP